MILYNLLKDINFKQSLKKMSNKLASINNNWSNEGKLKKTKIFLYIALQNFIFNLNACNSNLKAFGDNQPYYASSLNNLAALHMSTGEYNKAVSFYQQALDVRKKSLKEEHPDYAQSLTKPGCCL